MAGEINEEWLNNLAKTIKSIPDCKALGKYIEKLKKMFMDLIDSVLDEIAKLVGFIISPLNLAKVIKYLKNLALKWLGPYLAAIQKMIKLILAFNKVIQAIIAKRNALHCNPLNMVKAAAKSALSPTALKNAINRAVNRSGNPDLKTLSELSVLLSGRVPSLSVIAGQLGVDITGLPAVARTYGSAAKFFTAMEDKFQYVEVPTEVTVPAVDTPPDVYLDAGPPTITSISDPLGDEVGGNEITVNGTNFQEGIRVTLGDEDCTNVRVLMPTQLKCFTPAGRRGMPVNLQVQNPDGQSATLANAYAYMQATAGPAPTFTSITNLTGREQSNFGSKAGGDNIRILGENFQDGVTVQLGTLYPKVQVSGGGQVINFTSVYQPVYGPTNLIITNPDKQSVTVTNAWTYR